MHRFSTIRDAANYLEEMFGSEDCPRDASDCIRAAMREAGNVRYEDIDAAIMARAYEIANSEDEDD